MKKMKFGKVVLAMLAIMGLALGGCSGDNAASGTPVSGTVEFPQESAKVAAKTVAATAGPTLTITDLSGKEIAKPILTLKTGSTMNYDYKVTLPTGKDYVFTANWGTQVLKGLADASSLTSTALDFPVNPVSTAALLIVEQKLIESGHITAVGALGTSSISSVAPLSAGIAVVNPKELLQAIKTKSDYTSLVDAVSNAVKNATTSVPVDFSKIPGISDAASHYVLTSGSGSTSGGTTAPVGIVNSSPTSYYPVAVGYNWKYNVTPSSGSKYSYVSTVTKASATGYESKSVYNNGQPDAAYVYLYDNNAVKLSSINSGLQTSYSPSALIFPSSTVTNLTESLTSTISTGTVSAGTIQRAVVVNGEESVTVSAGTYNALKITTTLTNTPTSGAPTQSIFVAWYAKDVGRVKSVTYPTATPSNTTTVELALFSTTVATTPVTPDTPTTTNVLEKMVGLWIGDGWIISIAANGTVTGQGGFFESDTATIKPYKNGARLTMSKNQGIFWDLELKSDTELWISDLGSTSKTSKVTLPAFTTDMLDAKWFRTSTNIGFMLLKGGTTYSEGDQKPTWSVVNGALELKFPASGSASAYTETYKPASLEMVTGGIGGSYTATWSDTPGQSGTGTYTVKHQYEK